jgi:hypothetical protein
MATRILKFVAVGLMLTIGVTVFAMFSCDRRHGVNPNGSDLLANVGSLRINLTPRQLRLPSPEAIDSVAIVIAVLDSQGVGMPNIAVRMTRTPDIGYVTQPDSTDVQGRTIALYVTDPGAYDSVRITATAGNKQESALLYISGPSDYGLTLNYAPPVPKLIDHDGDPYFITASLVDSTQRGVSGQPVAFAILNRVGRIGFSDSSVTVIRTNSQGIAEALFYNTRADEISNPDHAEIQAVTPSPDGMGIIATTVIVPLRPVHNTLSLSVSPVEVIGDGTSQAGIRAFLRDTDGHGIANDTIRFRCVDQSGVVQAVRTTDENGIANAAFTPFAGIVIPETTQVLAEYRAGSIHNASATAEIRILPVSSIGTIIVSPQVSYVVADGIDSVSIFATVLDSTGRLISDGTVVYAYNTGLGSLSTPQMVTLNGQARTKLTSPTSIFMGPSVDTVIVRSSVSDSLFIADTAIVNYTAGPINNLSFVYPESTVTMVAGSGDTCSVIVYATDAHGNPVPDGTQISFRHGPVTESSLTPPASGTFEGYARSIYLVGSATGDDNVMAWIRKPSNPNDTIWTQHPVVFRCISSDATTLQLSAAQTRIQVGGSSTQILATLEDAYGNPLSEGYEVAFDITVSPGSSPIEKPSFDTRPGVYHDTAETNVNGQAIVQLYSGHKAGAVSIRACTIPSAQDSLYVCDEKSLVTISSGPPHHIQITSNNSGEGSPGQPERYCYVAALVWDRYTNPVEHGTAVYFSLIPDDLAEIEGNSYTGGGQPYLPDSTEGVAYSRIIYPCFSTFNFVQVVASSAGDSAEVADTSIALSLPIYEANIQVVARPGNLWTDNDSCNCHSMAYYNCRDTADVTITLTDGGGCPIEGGIINFAAQIAGNIIGQSVDTTDSNGHAYTSYMIRGCEIPCINGRCTIETSVIATLVQVPSVFGVVSIVCSRPPH